MGIHDEHNFNGFQLINIFFPHGNRCNLIKSVKIGDFVGYEQK